MLNPLTKRVKRESMSLEDLGSVRETSLTRILYLLVGSRSEIE